MKLIGTLAGLAAAQYGPNPIYQGAPMAPAAPAMDMNAMLPLLLMGGDSNIDPLMLMMMMGGMGGAGGAGGMGGMMGNPLMMMMLMGDSGSSGSSMMDDPLMLMMMMGGMGGAGGAGDMSAMLPLLLMGGDTYTIKTTLQVSEWTDACNNVADLAAKTACTNAVLAYNTAAAACTAATDQTLCLADLEVQETAIYTLTGTTAPSSGMDPLMMMMMMGGMGGMGGQATIDPATGLPVSGGMDPLMMMLMME